jgi:Ca2+:H+ antiporter
MTAMANNATARKLLRPALLVPIAALLLGLGLHLADEGLDHLPWAFQISLSAAVIAILFWTVFAALGHAEAAAHRLGEPRGTLLLTLAVTVIEASVIVSVMLHGKPNPAAAREAVFSTVMIVCAGVVGVCLLLGGWRYKAQDHKRQGTSALLSVVIALSVLTLVLPSHMVAGTPGAFRPIQLLFVSTMCLLLYSSFVYMQITCYREDFLDEAPSGSPAPHSSIYGLKGSLTLLAVGLAGIVLLAEHVAAVLEAWLGALHLEQTDAVVGAFIATLVLLPETVSAIRAALRNELQRSLNIALGSACATIGLTFPVVAMASLLTGHPLTLGLAHGDSVLLLLALAISIVSFGNARTNMLTGLVHLVVFVAFLLLIAVP